MGLSWGGAPQRGPAARTTAPPDSLAQRQAELVAALVAGGPEPAGFDPARLSATRRALLRKRAGAAARAWPALAAALGDEWQQTFARYRAGVPPVGALRDGWDIARALRAGGRLGPEASAELRMREEQLRYDGVTEPRPRLRHRIRRALLRVTRR